jgi:hypothetical protein
MVLLWPSIMLDYFSVAPKKIKDMQTAIERFLDEAPLDQELVRSASESRAVLRRQNK